MSNGVAHLPYENHFLFKKKQLSKKTIHFRNHPKYTERRLHSKIYRKIPQRTRQSESDQAPSILGSAGIGVWTSIRLSSHREILLRFWGKQFFFHLSQTASYRETILLLWFRKKCLDFEKKKYFLKILTFFPYVRYDIPKKWPLILKFRLLSMSSVQLWKY